MSRKTGQVSFNLRDPFEKELYDYCHTYPNFSGFIKRLIYNAKYGQQQTKQTTLQPINLELQQQSESGNIDSNMMKQFL